MADDRFDARWFCDAFGVGISDAIGHVVDRASIVSTRGGEGECLITGDRRLLRSRSDHRQ